MDEYKYHGFCAYISSYYMIDVDEYEVIESIITLSKLINWLINELF